MHAVHNTKAFVIKSQESGESNRRVRLFTEDFGLIVATVQGVRKQGAKLQMNLREYSYVSVDIVRGRDSWRLISISTIEDPISNLINSKLARAYVRSLSVVDRFCQGEEVNPSIFSHLRDCLDILKDDSIDPLSFDTLSIGKIMSYLGYWDANEISVKVLNLPILESAREIKSDFRKDLIKNINQIMKSTHL